MAVFWVIATCRLVEVNQRFTESSYLHISTTGMSANFYQPACTPEDGNLHIRRRDNVQLHGTELHCNNYLRFSECSVKLFNKN
jgi:hypothetical protein